MNEYQTLRQISLGLGLAKNTLQTLSYRHLDFPQPKIQTDNVSLYDPADVEAWYAARHIGGAS